MTTPVTATFFRSAGQMQDVATQKLLDAMNGVGADGRPISVGRQMQEINNAQANVSTTMAAINAYKKLLDALARA